MSYRCLFFPKLTPNPENLCLIF
uniref:Uncharacterized protein n=1 Tax=Lepeophtheirus salmonis TaxID=72036 RepID=A0A0K2UIJ2_LEPSM